MAIFVPEWGRISGRSVHVKRCLGALDDEHIIRRPLGDVSCPADLFVQHRAKGWMALAVEDAPFADLDPLQMFETPARGRLELRLAALEMLAAPEFGKTRRGIQSLVVLWSCSDDEANSISKKYLDRFGVRLVSRERFMRLGEKLVHGLLSDISIQSQESLLGAFFPEVEIPAAYTARRIVQRDNSATLMRCFLDIDQERASKLDLDLPTEQAETMSDLSVRLVNGVAGSGKTLIALSRALMLARMFPTQRVLMLIHNTPVVADIGERLHRVRGGVPANLELSTFFAWAHAQWRHTFRGAPRMADETRVLELIHHYRGQLPELRLVDRQIADELNFINEALLADERSYLEVSRAGRGFALRSRERSQVWSLYLVVTAALRESGLRMWSALPRDVCVARDRLDRMQRYHHILVDEAQFFAPSWFELVKRAMHPQGRLFLCADPNQGFMKNRLSWKSVGLDVSGRTRKLRKSYRTTRALLEAAGCVLGDLGGSDTDDFLQPDFEGMEAGEPPVVAYCEAPQDALDRLTNEVQLAARNGVALSSMLVLYGDRINKAALHAQLQRRLGQDVVWWFNEKSQKKRPPQGYGRDYLRMANVDTATGLEAALVFLVGGEGLFDSDDGFADDGERLAAREERARKLYMAMTRAGQRLVVISTRRLPRHLRDAFVEAPLPGPSSMGAS